MTTRLLVSGLVVVAIGVAAAWYAQGSRYSDNEQVQATPASELGEIALAHVQTQVDFGSRYHGAVGYEPFLAWAEEQLAACALVERQTFAHTGVDGIERTYTNLIARFYPDNTRRILYGTHFDTRQYADLDPDTPEVPVTGANDGASGVATFVTIAEMLCSATSTPTVGLDVVLFDAEEGEVVAEGYDVPEWRPLGSEYFVTTLDTYYASSTLEEVVVWDMVCDRDLTLHKDVASLVQFRGQVEALWEVGQRVNPTVWTDTPKYTIRDDHTAFQERGIPAQVVIDFDYPPFHTVDDTIDKCSAASLETVTRTAYEYLMTR
jgi:glutaminyl-peptide cyclotransferase